MGLVTHLQPPRGHAPRRQPLVERKRAQRRAARQRIARHAQTPCTAEQQAFDPLARQRRTFMQRLAAGLAWVLGSSFVHGSIVVLGLVLGSIETGRETVHEEVKIDVREHEVPPPPPPPEEKPPPPKPKEEVVVEQPV